MEYCSVGKWVQQSPKCGRVYHPYLNLMLGLRLSQDAGEPASPKAAATPTIETVANGEKPKDKQSGT